MRFLTGVFCMSAAAVAALGQGTNIVKTGLSQADTDRIVQKFSANEAAFRDALRNYVFSRSANIQTIGMGGEVTGTYRLDTEMLFTQDGTRREKIVFAPMPTVPPTFVTKEDLEDLGGVNAFALEPTMIPQYAFTYVGREKIDDLNLHVFDVAPRITPKPVKNATRMFIGRIWVDDKDYM
ncbi:MAG: hypothetical protein LC730_03255, partial [Acidobacteria bacterium]|nr:hypothetical protein [Acidobacteriota bacterium]